MEIENQLKTKNSVTLTWELFLIAIFKLIKGVLLVSFGFSLIFFFNEKSVIRLEEWFEFKHLVHNISLDSIFAKIDFVKKNKILFSLGSIFYSLVFFVEGIGLLAKKKWAEYFTLFVTSSLIPFEFYELAKKFTLVRSIIILINVLIVIYLYKKIFKNRD